MSGTPQSFTGNGAASEVDQSPLPLPYTVDATSAMYAPPMSVAPPSAETTPLQATPMASAPPTYVGGVSSDATPEEIQHQQQQSIETTYATVGGGDSAAVTVVEVNDGNSVEAGKRKRGRPKKIMTEGMEGGAAVVASDGGGTPAAGKFSGKRGRGRPKGSINRKHHEQFSFNVITQAVSGPEGVGFTPSIITVKAGEDVLIKLMSFSQYNTQAVCILSATGAISNVTLRQASSSGGTVNYEGRFEILSLSGSFLLMESGGQRSRTGGLSVSLAGPDGRVLGGGVAGLLIAASPVQVIVGTFNVASQQPTKSGHNEVYTAQPKLISGASMGGSPPSRATLSESSGGPGSPLNYSAGGCNNSNFQTIQNVTWR